MLDLIQENIDDNCALTLENLIAIVRDRFEVEVCVTTMHNAIGKFRYSLKRTQNIAIAADIIVLDNVRFHHSALVIEMLELRGFEYKFLPPYSPFFNGIECMFSEWKHYVKVGLQGHRARDEADLQERIRAFQLDPAHATAYCRHIATNCVAFIEGVRVFDN